LVGTETALVIHARHNVIAGPLLVGVFANILLLLLLLFFFPLLGGVKGGADGGLSLGGRGDDCGRSLGGRRRRGLGGEHPDCERVIGIFACTDDDIFGRINIHDGVQITVFHDGGQGWDSRRPLCHFEFLNRRCIKIVQSHGVKGLPLHPEKALPFGGLAVREERSGPRAIVEVLRLEHGRVMFR